MQIIEIGPDRQRPQVSGHIGTFKPPTDVSTSPARVIGLNIQNLDAVVAYVQIFEVASGGVTLGTTVPKYTIAVPSSGSLDVEFIRPLRCSPALSAAVTTGRFNSTQATTGCSIHWRLV
jgi:hypothetical protein